MKQKEIPQLNAEWHRKHKMPVHPTIEERINWHTEHLKNCRCRTDLPPGLKLLMQKRNIKIS